jgi:hypothetical protein
MTQTWQASTSQLQGLLAMKDGLEKMIADHEDKARIFTSIGEPDAAELHTGYAERLRGLLPSSP